MEDIIYRIIIAIFLIIVLWNFIINFKDKLKENKVNKWLNKNYYNKTNEEIFELLITREPDFFYNKFIKYVPKSEIFRNILSIKNKSLFDKLAVSFDHDVFIFDDYSEFKINYKFVEVLVETDIEDFLIDDLLFAYVMYFFCDKNKYEDKMFEIKKKIDLFCSKDWIQNFKNSINEFCLLLKNNDKIFDFDCFTLMFEDINKEEKTKVNMKSLAQKGVEHWINDHHIVYIEESHKYYVDGKEVPSVSDILRKQSFKYGFDDYYRVDRNTLNKAASKGTLMHKIIQDYEETGVCDYSSQELQNYIEVKKQEKIACLKNEVIVLYCSKDNEPLFCGRVDMVVLKNNELGILDLKRTNKFYLDKYTLQLNLYRIAYMQSYRENITFLYCLRLRETIKDFRRIYVSENMAKQHLLEFYNNKIEI